MPNSNLIKRILISNNGIKYSDEANALFAKWESIGSPAPTVDKKAINETIVYLKSTGQWNILDCLYKFDVHSKAAALIDWKNPTTRTATIVNDHGASFTAYVGLKGNGSNFRVLTNFNPSTGINYTLNSACHGLYINSEDGLSTKIDLSAEVSNYSGVNTAIFGNNNPIGTRNAVNNGSDSVTQTSSQMKGWHIVKRTASNAYQIRKNGQNTERITRTSASTSLPNLNVNLFCRNINDTTYSLYSNRYITGCFFGRGTINDTLLVNGLNIHSISVASISSKAVVVDGNSFTAMGYYTARLFPGLSSPVIDFVNGLSGIATTTMTANFPTSLGYIDLSKYSKKVLFMWELTNDFTANSSNATTTYNNLVTYLQQVRALKPDWKIIVATMMPRNNTQVINANRQNDSNLLDDTTLNGKIRNHLVQDGYADLICDTASDPTMGIYSGGVAGVGEKNTTYYSDQVHPTPTGYYYLTDNYIIPSINSQL